MLAVILAFVVAPFVWRRYLRLWQKLVWRDLRAPAQFHAIFSSGLPGFYASTTAWLVFLPCGVLFGLLGLAVAQGLGTMGFAVAFVANTMSIALLIATGWAALNFVVFLVKRFGQAKAVARSIPHAAWPVSALFTRNTPWLLVPALVVPGLWFGSTLVAGAYTAHVEQSKAEAAEHERITSVAQVLAKKEPGWATTCRTFRSDSRSSILPLEATKTNDDCTRDIDALVAGIKDGPFLLAWRGEALPAELPPQPLADAASVDRLRQAGLREDACALLDLVARGRRIAELEAAIPDFRARAKDCVADEHIFPSERWSDSRMWCQTGLLVDLKQRSAIMSSHRTESGPACWLPVWGATQPVKLAKGAFQKSDDVIEKLNERLNETPSAVLACYDDALRAKPKLKGQITVQFEVANDGSTSAVKLATAELPDELAIACLTKALGEWAFPRPVLPTQVELTLEFEPSRTGNAR